MSHTYQILFYQSVGIEFIMKSPIFSVYSTPHTCCCILQSCNLSTSVVIAIHGNDRYVYIAVNISQTLQINFHISPVI